MGILASLVLGRDLSILTSLVEQTQSRELRNRQGLVGLDAWDQTSQRKIEREFLRRTSRIAKFSKQRITKELGRNAALALRMGRPERASAIFKLINMLSDLHLAITLDEYELYCM